MRKSLITFVYISFFLSASAQIHNIGNTTIDFIDPERNNRKINTVIYYPSLVQGQDQPIADGQFPVIVFGHGFVMVHTAYQFFWDNMVPEGYIVAFPTTEGSFSPSHNDFGLDLAFLVNQLKLEGQDHNSFFFEAVSETSAIMGHSMGGGASFLACSGNTVPTTIVTFAAANTNPSSIEAATNVNIPTLMFAGKNDCVTPPGQHQYPIFEATSSPQKIMIDIKGGGHCFFANYNLFCSIGEGSCSPQPTITRQKQQDITLDFLGIYFDFILKGGQDSWHNFLDSLQTSNEIDYLIEWLSVDIPRLENDQPFSIFPNPFKNSLNIDFLLAMPEAKIAIYDSSGRIIDQYIFSEKTKINTNSWPSGLYIVLVSSNDSIWQKKIIKE